MQLHYIFDLAYAKELKPFFLLLERIANLDIHRSYTSLMDLYHELKLQGDLIEEENLARIESAESGSTETTPDDNAIPPATPQDETETLHGPQDEEDAQEILPTD
uniref:Uncharacterized protein n=1 Tax=Panagrolaimus superbus TaxID=310955 RepID=A0A914Z7J1_9BILA